MFDKVFFSLQNIVDILHQGKIIAYPTESVFGLGCDPDNEIAVHKLLELKKRSWKKGLILIAANYKQLIPYIDLNVLISIQKKMIFSTKNKFTTWVVPAKKDTPPWLTGEFNSLAVRITDFELVKKLCSLYGKPLVSTSANLNGFLPCKTKEEVISQFNHRIFILEGSTGGYKNPSEIRDIITNYLYRKG